MARYQAFISYKHVASSRFAENLELAIKAYAKPWLRPPIAIFRDEKYLRPGIDLPGMIERALAESRFLIYLASPKAAASRWVQRELMRWCADPERLERLIIVLTDGTLETIEGGTTIDWERTDVLPAPLRNVLTEVPYYVDLAWAVDERMQSLLDPEFKKAVNAIVAALRQVDPVELSGEEIRQHRRNLRVRNGFVAAITLLAVGLGVSAGIVLDQRNEVLVQRDELLVQRNEVLVQRNAAEARAREATSRRLAAEADRLTEDRFDTALLLMAQAYRMGDNSALRASWWRLLGTRSRPALYLPESAVDGGFGLAGDLLLRTGAGRSVYSLRDGRWRASSGGDRSGFFESAKTSWSWRGGCEDGGCSEDGPWQCAAYGSVEIGPYGDQDSVCVESEVAVADWCGGAPVRVPGAEVEVAVKGSWLEVKVEESMYRFACVEGQRAVIVTAPAEYLDGRGTRGRVRVDLTDAYLGPPIRRVSWSIDRRWVAVFRNDGTVEIWPRVGEGSRTPTGRGTESSGDASARLGVRTVPVTGVRTLALQGRAVALVVRTEASASVPPVGQSFPRTIGATPMEIRVWREAGDVLRGAQPDLRLTSDILWREGIVTLSDGGGRIAAATDVEIAVWDGRSGAELPRRPYLGRFDTLGASLSPGGDLLAALSRPKSGGRPAGVWLFDPQREEPLGILKEGASGVAFDPARPGTLWTASEDGVERWSLAGKEPETTVVVGEPTRRLVVEPGRGRLAAVLEDGRLLVLDPDDPDRRFVSSRRADPTDGLAFVPPDELLIRASAGGLEAWHWPQDTWYPLSGERHSEVYGLGDHVVLSRRGGSLLVYDLDPERWLELTCGMVNRNLTAREWEVHLGDFSYECTCLDRPPGAGAPIEACP